MDKEVEKYIGKRYDRWLDYASYHCSLNGLAGEEVDVLNEVLLSLLQKDESTVINLLNTRSGQYRELDFFVLSMIKLNATSDTAPYRAKYKSIPTDVNTDWTRIDIEDELTDQDDRSGYVYERMTDLRTIIDQMYFGPRAMAIFEFKFFQDGDFKQWPGTENIKELYAIYSEIRKTIKRKLNGELIF